MGNNQSFSDRACFSLACAVILQAIEDYIQLYTTMEEKDAIIEYLRSDDSILAFAPNYARVAAYMLEEYETIIIENRKHLYA